MALRVVEFRQAADSAAVVEARRAVEEASEDGAVVGREEGLAAAAARWADGPAEWADPVAGLISPA